MLLCHSTCTPNCFFALLSLLLIVDLSGTISAREVGADGQCDSIGAQSESNKLHASALIQVQRSKSFAVSKAANRSSEFPEANVSSAVTTAAEIPSHLSTAQERGLLQVQQEATESAPDPKYLELSTLCSGAGAELAPGTSDVSTFRCKGGRCIPLAGKCNGVANCIDNSDELGCADEHSSAIAAPSAKPNAVDGASFLHQVVGPDGVLMLSLARGNFERYNYASEQLKKVGIAPTKFIATDGKDASPEVLAQGCFARLSGNRAGKTGTGCVSKVEQAITESHRQALAAALQRNENWTAIFEDDAVPVLDEIGTWDAELKRSWSQLPEGVGMIRLGWCQAPGTSFAVGNWPTNYPRSILSTEAVGTFMWSRTPRPGGCTTAYLVHKRIIPELLGIFPCSCAMDCCLEWDYFAKKQRATTTLINLEARGSVEYIQKHGGVDWGVHHGVIMQAKRQLSSTRSMLAARLKTRAQAGPGPEPP